MPDEIRVSAVAGGFSLHWVASPEDGTARSGSLLQKREARHSPWRASAEHEEGEESSFGIRRGSTG